MAEAGVEARLGLEARRIEIAETGFQIEAGMRGNVELDFDPGRMPVEPVESAMFLGRVNFNVNRIAFLRLSDWPEEVRV